MIKLTIIYRYSYIIIVLRANVGLRMAKKIKCAICGTTADKGDLFCGKCGSDLPKENWDKRVELKTTTETQKEDSYPKVSPKIAYTSQTEPNQTIKVDVPKTPRRVRRKWYKPPKRPRPWYHPIEWFFWIGWGIYVFFRFIITEIIIFFVWACYWGPPRELKRE